MTPEERAEERYHSAGHTFPHPTIVDGFWHNVHCPECGWIGSQGDGTWSWDGEDNYCPKCEPQQYTCEISDSEVAIARNACATTIREQVEPLEAEIRMIETIGGLSFKPGRRPYELVAELAASRGDALSKIDELEADNAKLRALVQVLFDALANMKIDIYGPLTTELKAAVIALNAAKEEGFVPTNTEDK